VNIHSRGAGPFLPQGKILSLHTQGPLDALDDDALGYDDSRSTSEKGSPTPNAAVLRH
jgi:hypothetical protein